MNEFWIEDFLTNKFNEDYMLDFVQGEHIINIEGNELRKGEYFNYTFDGVFYVINSQSRVRKILSYLVQGYVDFRGIRYFIVINKTTNGERIIEITKESTLLGL